MASWHILIIFIITTLAFAYMPGPAMLYTATQTLTKGRKAGLMAVLGIHLGGYFHVMIATLGLTVIFEIIPMLYFVVKLIGACWLIFLGWQLLQTKFSANTDTVLNDLSPQTFRQSIWVEVLNPKTAIFYAAFLPQFTDVHAVFSIWLQFLLLGLFVNLAFTSADVCCVYLAQGIIRKLKTTAKRQRWMRRVGASVFMGMGIYLIVNDK